LSNARTKDFQYRVKINEWSTLDVVQLRSLARKRLESKWDLLWSFLPARGFIKSQKKTTCQNTFEILPPHLELLTCNLQKPCPKKFFPLWPDLNYLLSKPLRLISLANYYTRCEQLFGEVPGSKCWSRNQLPPIEKAKHKWILERLNERFFLP
jgi:hypothetical protein